jgi:hypothetical protein
VEGEIAYRRRLYVGYESSFPYARDISEAI